MGRGFDFDVDGIRAAGWGGPGHRVDSGTGFGRGPQPIRGVGGGHDSGSLPVRAEGGDREVDWDVGHAGDPRAEVERIGVDDDEEGIHAGVDLIGDLVRSDGELRGAGCPFTIPEIRDAARTEGRPPATPRTGLESNLHQQVGRVRGASVNNVGGDGRLPVEHPQRVGASVGRGVDQRCPLPVVDQAGVVQAGFHFTGGDARPIPGSAGGIESGEGHKRILLRTAGRGGTGMDGQDDPEGRAVAPLHHVGEGERAG